MQNLLFPAGQIIVEVMYIRVFAKKPSHFRRTDQGYIKKEKILYTPGSSGQSGEKASGPERIRTSDLLIRSVILAILIVLF